MTHADAVGGDLLDRRPGGAALRPPGADARAAVLLGLRRDARRRLVPRDPRGGAGAAALPARPRADPAVPGRRDARVHPGKPVLVDDSDDNARALAGSIDARGAHAPVRACVRVAYEQTGLELDATGSARAARELRAALEPRVATSSSWTSRSRRPRRARAARAGARADVVPAAARPRRARRVGAEVLHCPMPLAPPRPQATATVVTVNDAIPWDHPRVADARARAARPHRARARRCGTPRR